MKITSSNVHVEVDSTNGLCVCDISRDLSGYAASFRFFERMGAVYLAKKKDEPLTFYVLMVPGPEWKKDLEDAGWEIVQKLSDAFQPLTKGKR